MRAAGEGWCSGQCQLAPRAGRGPMHSLGQATWMDGHASASRCQDMRPVNKFSGPELLQQPSQTSDHTPVAGAISMLNVMHARC
eukprot:351140-Chlamydomonas_euryale.AAC.6